MSIFLKPHARISLISEINAAMVNATETFRLDDTGVALSYLYPAICSDTRYQVMGNPEGALFVNKLIEVIGVSHLVWLFIDLRELPMSTLATLWEKFGDIPTDDDECIEDTFLHFDAGTHREEIWEWFESANENFVVGEVISGYLREHNDDIQKTKPVVLVHSTSFTKGEIIAAFEDSCFCKITNPDLLINTIVADVEVNGYSQEGGLTGYAQSFFRRNHNAFKLFSSYAANHAA